jgi:hypothetical protein
MVCVGLGLGVLTAPLRNLYFYDRSKSEHAFGFEMDGEYVYGYVAVAGASG